MVRSARIVLAGVIGAAVGYLCLTIAANLEDWQFYTVRSFVTGRSVMSEIVAHPADRWVLPVLLAVALIGGAAAGMLVARHGRALAQRGKSSEA